MKKILSITLLISALVSSSMAYAQNQQTVDPLFVMLDVVLYRPVGLVATVVGAGVLVGISPLVALASIPKPHDAFQKTAGILILAPAAYTFVRPVGDKGFPYDEPADRHLREISGVNVTTTKEVYPAVPAKLITPVVPSLPNSKPKATIPKL